MARSFDKIFFSFSRRSSNKETYVIIVRHKSLNRVSEHSISHLPIWLKDVMASNVRALSRVPPPPPLFHLNEINYSYMRKKILIEMGCTFSSLLVIKSNVSISFIFLFDMYIYINKPLQHGGTNHTHCIFLIEGIWPLAFTM